MSKTDAARLLGVSRKTVADLMRHHRIKAVPVRGRGKGTAHGVDRETFDRLRSLLPLSRGASVAS